MKNNPMLTIRKITDILEATAPPSLQEDYDNSGLLTGNPEQAVTGVLVTLDCTEQVVEEALSKNCNLIIAHHPILFKGIKRLTGSGYVERTLLSAIRNDIAIYAIHTNLDNVLSMGVSEYMAKKLGMTGLKVLEPKTGKLAKLITFAPDDSADAVREALFNAGAGHIGHYDACSFNTHGTGTFRGDEHSQPARGLKLTLHREPETRIEVILPVYLKNRVISALKQAHPYEEVAYDVILLENEWDKAGSGVIGSLPEPLSPRDFLSLIKDRFKAPVIRYTRYDQPVKTIALCGGAGSFLREKALRSGADAFLTADFKYHEFFDAEGRMMICDIGHFESEQFTPELIIDILRKKIPNFAPILAETNTNPVNYFY